MMAIHILSLIKKALCVYAVLIMINIILSWANLPERYEEILHKLIYGWMIILVGWVLFQILKIGEGWSRQQLEKNELDGNLLKSQFTKIKIIRQVLNYLIVIITIAAILMLFDYVRTIGISLIASAGLFSAVLGFAAQKPLSSIFTGIQLAISQPIKLDDIVIIEGEYGIIEEITMSYAVVKLWDARRMVVPLNYFFDKPIQNWSYRKGNLVGTIFFYVDYDAPIEVLRDEAKRIIESSSLWDKGVWNLQVTNMSVDSIELRVTVSANDPANLWGLRVYIREKLIAFISKEYPIYFPKKRLVVHEINH